MERRILYALVKTVEGGRKVRER